MLEKGKILFYLLYIILEIINEISAKDCSLVNFFDDMINAFQKI